MKLEPSGEGKEGSCGEREQLVHTQEVEKACEPQVAHPAGECPEMSVQVQMAKGLMRQAKVVGFNLMVSHFQTFQTWPLT